MIIYAEVGPNLVYHRMGDETNGSGNTLVIGGKAEEKPFKMLDSSVDDKGCNWLWVST